MADRNEFYGGDAAIWNAIPAPEPSSGSPAWRAYSDQGTAPTPTAPVKHYSAALITFAVAGFGVAAIGLALSIVSAKVWPVGVLFVGLATIWGVGWFAQRRPGRGYGDPSISRWSSIKWAATRS